MLLRVEIRENVVVLYAILVFRLFFIHLESLKLLIKVWAAFVESIVIMLRI